MSVIIVLILASLMVGLIFLAAFIWSVRSGQYDDTLTPAMRVLLDDAETRHPLRKVGLKAAPLPVFEHPPGAVKISNKLKPNIDKTAQLGAVAPFLTAATLGESAADSANWLDNTISLVAKPILSEPPNITSELRPIHME